MQFSVAILRCLPPHLTVGLRRSYCHAMLTKQVFLASSAELRADRQEFEILINRKNKEWVDHGVFLKLVVWEDFLDAVSGTRLQDEYNKEILDTDIFVMLFFTKVGQYTREEFETAYQQFHATKTKPRIFTYFKESGPASEDRSQSSSVIEFQKRLSAIEHFYTVYPHIDTLKYHFNQQLDKLAAIGFIELGPVKAVPFQAPPPAADHAPRTTEVTQMKGYFVDVNGQLQAKTVGLHGFGGAGKTTLARLFCADAEVRAACHDGILWVPVGKNPPEPRAQIADLAIALEGDCNGCTTLQGAKGRLQAALAGKKLLLVIDDVWDEAQVKDILEVSPSCARLITTRNTFTLPFEATLVDIGTMQEGDARRLLSAGLPAGEEGRFTALAQQLGNWPVLLRLANRALRRRVGQNTPLTGALDAVEREMNRKGVLAFDPATNATERDQAVAASVDASLELLSVDERQRYGELAVFPQDVPIPLARAAELWELTAGLAFEESEDLVTSRLEPLSLLDYDGGTATIQIHDVMRRYMSAKLPGKASIHLKLAGRWGDRPRQSNGYGWRWVAFHLARAAIASEQPERHQLTEHVVNLVSGSNWQEAHESALGDLTAVRAALLSGLDAATADDAPAGLPLLVNAADSIVRFDREHSRAEPIIELARLGDLSGARRRTGLFAVDDHWRQTLLLTAAWLAPESRLGEAQALVEEVENQIGGGAERQLQDLLRWIRVDLWKEPEPSFAFSVDPNEADAALIAELLKRVGGGQYNREFLIARNVDTNVHNPDMATRGLSRKAAPGEEETTGYLAELDGPYLAAYLAQNPTAGVRALEGYLSVYTNYSYLEYRFSTLWLLLGFMLQLPLAGGGVWVRECLLRIVAAAFAGGSVEFEQGLPIATTALRARMTDAAARQSLIDQAHELINEAARLKPGRDREGSDIWADHKRLMLATAQSLGWLLDEDALALQVLHDALGLAESGFAGYQAPACIALAEAFQVCGQGNPHRLADIEQALTWAQLAAHNIQDPSFCARMTARVNAMRKRWFPDFNAVERVRWLADGTRFEMAALHRVGHEYTGRRPDALKFPGWARKETSFDGLQRLYKRPKTDFLKLNGQDRDFDVNDEVGVPDPGFLPHIAARISAEILVEAGKAELLPERLRQLRSLVPHALRSPTALDAVLTRLVLAQGRGPAPAIADIDALEAVLSRRPPIRRADPGTELTAIPRLPA